MLLPRTGLSTGGWVILALLAVSCSSTESVERAAVNVGTTGAEEDSPDTLGGSSPLPDTTSPQPLAGFSYDGVAKEFDVGGTEVVARVDSATLPIVATTARFPTTVVQDPNGQLALCSAAAVDSVAPPNCADLAIDAIDPAFLTEHQDGVSWGYVDITIALPEDSSETSRVLAAMPPEGPRWTFAEGADCPTDRRADLEAFAATVGLGSDAIVPVAGGGLVLPVGASQVSEHAEELARRGLAACVAAVIHDDAEIASVYDRAVDAWPLVQEAWIGPGGRVNATVLVADQATVEAVVEVFEAEPTMLRVIGLAEIG